MNRRSFFSGLAAACASLAWWKPKADGAIYHVADTSGPVVCSGQFESLASDRQVVFEAIGEASMCWEHPYSGGVFKSEDAKVIGDRVLSHFAGRSESNPMTMLTENLRNNSSYAWSWHCNLACCSMDEGMSHAASNRAAARFMKLAFGIDTTKHENYPA